MVESKVWVDIGRDDLVPHEYQSWYRHYPNERREGPIPEGDVPMFVLEAVFRIGTADHKDRSIGDAKDPKLEDAACTLVYSVDADNWNG